MQSFGEDVVVVLGTVVLMVVLIGVVVVLGAVVDSGGGVHGSKLVSILQDALQYATAHHPSPSVTL